VLGWEKIRKQNSIPNPATSINTFWVTPLLPSGLNAPQARDEASHLENLGSSE